MKASYPLWNSHVQADASWILETQHLKAVLPAQFVQYTHTWESLWCHVFSFMTSMKKSQLIQATLLPPCLNGFISLCLECCLFLVPDERIFASQLLSPLTFCQLCLGVAFWEILHGELDSTELDRMIL